MRKICVVTGSRAEYGLTSKLIRKIYESDKTQLQLIATNMHLSPIYGNTYQEIENDGIPIDKKIPIIDEVGSNDAKAILLSMSKELPGLADAYDDLKPDLLFLVGDRYEMLCAAAAALIMKIPVAHFGGGNVTEGAFDDAIRHSITKMSHLHFVSTEKYRKRVIQLGELPERVFNYGSLGVENVTSMPLMDKAEVEKSIDFIIDENTVLATYHPVTLSETSLVEDIDSFLGAIKEFPDLKVIFTMPNSDTGGEVIADKIQEFVNSDSNHYRVFKSLGVKRYLSVMKYSRAVIGNSSSGIAETPSFHKPTLNIGDRQKGRVAADSVVNCNVDKESIVEGLRKVLSDEYAEIAKNAENPYEKPHIVDSIFETISTYPLEHLIKKPFYDLPIWNV